LAQNHDDNERDDYGEARGDEVQKPSLVLRARCKKSLDEQCNGYFARAQRDHDQNVGNVVVLDRQLRFVGAQVKRMSRATVGSGDGEQDRERQYERLR
jgi:hypothetical protein